MRFLLAEGMIIVEKYLGYNDVLLTCAAPILRSIITCDISMPDIQLSEGEKAPDDSIIDLKWLLEHTI